MPSYNSVTNRVYGLGRQIDGSTFQPVQSNKVALYIGKGGDDNVGCDPGIIKIIQLYDGPLTYLGQLSLIIRSNINPNDRGNFAITYQ